MKKFLVAAVALAGCGSVVLASNLNVSVRSNGANEITVAPNAVVNYEVFGILNDTLNDGMALVGFDLAFSGGPLTQANNPTTAPMNNFANNLGINNPDGFGGTVQSGILKQVGGGQNTIKNTPENAPAPIGTVIANVGQPPSGVVIVTGSLTAPAAEGDYTLSLTNLFGNVIKDGETGEVFFKTEAFGVGSITNLVVRVVPDEDAILMGSTPGSCTTANGSGASLWRSANNVLLADFDRAITAPGAGQVEINELLSAPAGGFGTNLNTDANFTFTVETGPNGPNTRLRIRENGTFLAHRKWFAFRNTGAWLNVEDFSIKLVVQVGDATGDGRVVGADASAINACVTCPNVEAGCANPACAAPQNRRDIDGNNRIVGLDVSLANVSITSANVTVPTGHTCP